MQVLFFKPYFQEKIWGGTALKDEFGYNIPSDHTGECWAISAHPHGESIVENGSLKGMKLSEVWSKHPELFGNSKQPVFPLLTKILDASDDLSVQVHPNDEYGMKHEGELGKTECWYVIDAKPGSKIVYGHKAKTKDEFKKLVDEGKWNELLTEIEVKPGDFFFVPSGTIHGIGKGILILETQQSSDTTYRVYDYDRTDDRGNTRELHIEDSLNVATIPAKSPVQDIQEIKYKNSVVTILAKTPFFDVYKWDVDGELDLTATAPYTLVSIIDGSGILNINNEEYNVSKGQHFIIPDGINNWTLSGKLTAIASTPGKDNK